MVADEVRKLAEHSRSATKDIAALIKAIQAETNDAVIVMEEGTREVEIGAKLADQAGRALDAISSVVGNRRNWCRKFHWLQSSRCAVRKA